jgi:hypothetical protein
MRPIQQHLTEPTMARDDVLVLLSFASFTALWGATIWALLLL